jgi:hypothetical protein
MARHVATIIQCSCEKLRLKPHWNVSCSAVLRRDQVCMLNLCFDNQSAAELVKGQHK